MTTLDVEAGAQSAGGPIRRLWRRWGQSDLNWRVVLFGALISAVCAAATPYVTLKLGMTADLSYGGMFLAAVLLSRSAGRRLAIQLNLIQTMINMVAGIGFMAVILASFFYIQVVFKRDIGFDPTWWQVTIWLFVSANLGVFMGALPRTMLLNDASLPWPGGKAIQSVVETLSDPSAAETTRLRRAVLAVSTASSGFLTFLKEGGLNVLPTFVGKKSVNIALGFEFTAFGFGMLVPLAVGLSGVLGVWLLDAFGETIAPYAALSGTAGAHWNQCVDLFHQGAKIVGNDEATKTFLGTHGDFLRTSCGTATDASSSALDYLNNLFKSKSIFVFVVRWMMWPATAMMITASLTSVILPLVRNWLERRRNQKTRAPMPSMADEFVPRSWIWCGITICTVALVWIQHAWFNTPWQQVLVAVGMQPILIIAGARVLGITGQGPVSLMANATQGLFGLLWPAHIKQNLIAAHVSADPQASSEATITSFYVARRVGGRFRTLILSQLIIAPIGCILLPIMFTLLLQQYGIGPEEGQLSAPTAIKISSLALVMEKGVAALPSGALTASIVAALLGIGIELLLFIYKKNKDGSIAMDADGNPRQMFWWLPIPSALGFALILPPVISLTTALGSMVAYGWRRLSPSRDGSYGRFCAPIGAGLIAGEAVVGGILLPIIGFLIAMLIPHFSL